MKTIGKSLDVLHIFSYFPYSLNWLKDVEGNLCRKALEHLEVAKNLPAKAPSGKSPWISSIRDKACGGKLSMFEKKKRDLSGGKLWLKFFLFTISLSLSLSLGVASIYKSWTILRFLPIFCENNSGMTDDWATHLGSSSQTCSTHLKHIKQIILSSRDEKAQKHQKPWAWGYQALCHYWSTLW